MTLRSTSSLVAALAGSIALVAVFCGQRGFAMAVLGGAAWQSINIAMWAWLISYTNRPRSTELTWRIGLVAILKFPLWIGLGAWVVWAWEPSAVGTLLGISTWLVIWLAQALRQAWQTRHDHSVTVA